MSVPMFARKAPKMEGREREIQRLSGCMGYTAVYEGISYIVHACE